MDDNRMRRPFKHTSILSLQYYGLMLSTDVILFSILKVRKTTQLVRHVQIVKM